MAYFDFYYVFRYLESISFFDIVVPFLLIFAILFSLLEKTHLFGKDTNVGVNALVALLLSFLSIINTKLITWLNLYLGNFSITLIALAVTLLMFQFLLGLENKWLGGVSIFVGVLAVLIVLIQSEFYNPYGPYTSQLNQILIYFMPFLAPLVVLVSIGLFIAILIVLAKKGRKPQHHT